MIVIFAQDAGADYERSSGNFAKHGKHMLEKDVP